MSVKIVSQTGSLKEHDYTYDNPYHCKKHNYRLLQLVYIIVPVLGYPTVSIIHCPVTT